MDKVAEGKKPLTKKRITARVFAIILTIVAGVGTGFYCGMLYLSSKIPKVNYGAYDETILRANAQEIIQKNSGKSVSDMSAVDAFVIAQYNTENASQYISLANSSLSHNFGKQSVYSYKHKYNGNYLAKEISSSSMKSIANKFLFDGETILVYPGSVKSSTTAEWSNNYQTLTKEEYKKVYGVNAFELVPYIVSEKTIADGFTPEKGKKLSNGNWQFTLKLNTKSSVINYVKKIKKESNISGYPTFSQLDIVFEINSECKFASITSIEVYSFSYSGIAVTCSGSIKTEFDYSKTPTEI